MDRSHGRGKENGDIVCVSIRRITLAILLQFYHYHMNTFTRSLRNTITILKCIEICMYFCVCAMCSNENNSKLHSLVVVFFAVINRWQEPFENVAAFRWKNGGLQMHNMRI